MNLTIKEAYNLCRPYEDLPAGDPRYIPFTDRGLRGSAGDIIKQMEDEISLSSDASHQLVSGFRGCGKTTELHRLAANLKKSGYLVAMVDTEDYLNLRVPVTVSDLWISIAGGLDRFLQEQGAVIEGFDRFWRRLVAFLGRLQSTKGKIAIPQVGEIELSLKDNPEFRQKLNEAIADLKPQLVGECRNFLDEGIALLQKKHPSSGLVMILDSFEKTQGDGNLEQAVRESVKSLFLRDCNLLRTPCHAIFTVPPWLAFTETLADCNLGRTRILPMCKVAERDGSACREGIEAMLDLLDKRMSLNQIFGGRKVLEALVETSGGYPRDLLRMIQEVLLRNSDAPSLPLPEAKVKQDVQQVIWSYTQTYELGLDGEDLPLLVLLHNEGNITAWPRDDKFRLAHLFDHHFVLSYQNHEQWFRLHPLLRRTASVQKAIQEAAKTVSP